MPTLRVNVQSKTKGIIFNAAATKAAAKRMIIKVNEVIAQEGVNRVRQRLSVVLRHPTGYYESNIAVNRRTIYRGFWDRGVVYGGWLEGVDARNKTTRFKGYRTFRLVKQSIDRDAVRLAQPQVSRFVREMNGGGR